MHLRMKEGGRLRAARAQLHPCILPQAALLPVACVAGRLVGRMCDPLPVRSTETRNSSIPRGSETLIVDPNFVKSLDKSIPCAWGT